ncbi:helix-turn-helix transcriptional regulator [Janibacter alittae]|uniref:HTH luxR-type domain-containing protein n=1 Tax=Janibacter alittae TaxID=3115209 RepID=A0ABZ2MHV9_9MICO
MSPTSDSDEPLRRLEAYLAEDAARVDEARGRLADIGDALMTLRARMHNIDIGDDPGVQVLTHEVAAPMIDRVAGGVDRVDNVMLSIDVGAGTEHVNARNELTRAAAGQRQRTLVHPSVLEADLGRSQLAASREAGQQQRVTDQLGTEFLVLGEEALVTLSVWGDPHSPYVFIRNPALVACFAAWFDLLWSRAPEIKTPAWRSDEALVRMLALGTKDEMIARTLHVGLRTVRRRVARLMDQYGVDTRFQLGAALERDGRL